MHQAIKHLAEWVGVEFSLHVACYDEYNDDHPYQLLKTGKHIFDGESIAIRYETHFKIIKYFSDHENLHEVFHYFVAAPEQRDLPEYGLGNADFASTPPVVDLECEDLKESNMQELVVQLLCIWFGKKYNVSVFLSQCPDFAYSWEKYTEIKLGEMALRGWEAITRFHKKREELERAGF